MNLIIILISLAIERFLGSLEDYRRFDWFDDFCDVVMTRLSQWRWSDGPIGVVFTVGPVVLGIWLIASLAHAVTPVFAFLFAIVVLLFCIGPKDLERDVEGYLDAMDRGDYEGGAWYASAVLNREVSAPPAEMARRVRDAVLVKSNDRLLGVLFWFVVLGPVGAMLFRLTSMAREHLHGEATGYAKSVGDLYAILLWPVARLSVMAYALAGSFMETFSQWRHVSDVWQWDSEDLLIRSGRGALRQTGDPAGSARVGGRDPGAEAETMKQDTASASRADEQAEPDTEAVRDALALIKRTLIIWIALLAIMTLTGWAS